MTRHIGRFLLALPLLLGIVGILAGGPVRAAGGTVAVLPATGVVDNVMAGYLSEGIAVAARTRRRGRGHPAQHAGRQPRRHPEDRLEPARSADPDDRLGRAVGGRAASAGTFITLAANVAVMASGTNIGAASPISSSGEDIGGTLGQKVLNDAIANIRSIAEVRGRNVDWAEETVRDARSSPASEAVEVGAVDGIADSIDARHRLRQWPDGRPWPASS